MQTQINFTNNEAEIQVLSDFNIHLEREKDGSIVILLKTSGNFYVPTTQFPNNYKDFDYDFASYVYPKYIKIISSSKVIKGILTTNE